MVFSDKCFFFLFSLEVGFFFSGVPSQNMKQCSNENIFRVFLLNQSQWVNRVSWDSAPLPFFQHIFSMDYLFFLFCVTNIIMRNFQKIKTSRFPQLPIFVKSEWNSFDSPHRFQLKIRINFGLGQIYSLDHIFSFISVIVKFSIRSNLNIAVEGWSV